MATTILTTTRMLVFRGDLGFTRDDDGNAYLYDEDRTVASINAKRFVAQIDTKPADRTETSREIQVYDP